MSSQLAPHADNLYIGKGKLYFDRFTAAGGRQGFFHLGNCDTLEITTDDTKLSLRSSMDAATPVLKEIVTERNARLAIQGHEMTPQNLAVALMGTTASLVQTSANITAEVIATATQFVSKGRYFQTLGRGITGLVVSQGAALTATVDYELTDAVNGLIFIPPGSGAATGTAITADYTRAALTENEIIGGTLSVIEGKLIMRPDPKAGPSYDLEVFKVSLTPDGALGLITDEWGEWSLQGLCLDDSAGLYGGSVSKPLYRMVER